jgi:hypothetical protein
MICLLIKLGVEGNNSSIGVFEFTIELEEISCRIRSSPNACRSS